MKKNFLVMLMLMLVQIVSAANGTPVRIDDFFYYLDSDKKEAEITYDSDRDNHGFGVHPVYYNGSISIPESVSNNGETYKVTSIGESAFEYNINLQCVNLPNSIKTIKERAFRYCPALQSITIPKSVEYIENGFLQYCNGLTSIIVDKENKVYDSRNDCNAIIETETDELIQGCQNTIIPNTVKRIGYKAFYDLKSLTSIDIPNSVTSIGDYAFSETGLIKLVLPNSVVNIGVEMVSDCKDLTTLILSESLESLPGGTVCYNDKLKSIVIPASVKFMEEGAITTGIDSIIFMSSTPPSGIAGGINSYLSGTTIHIPVGAMNNYENDYWKYFKAIIDDVVPQQATGISVQKQKLSIQDSNRYTLNGKRISAPCRGIDIVNGKKYLSK